MYAIYISHIFLKLFCFLLLGQYNTLFEVLDRHFEEDYRKYVGLDRNLLAEVVRRVSPRIAKSPKYVHAILNVQ